MDPRKQECFGQFLYGAGYFARDENTLAIGGGAQRQNFCQHCVRHTACEHEHELRVRALRPAAVEEYDRAMAEGRRRGRPDLLVKLLLGEVNGDPFAAHAIDNFNRGHGDRGRVSGLIAHSDADPRRR